MRLRSRPPTMSNGVVERESKREGPQLGALSPTQRAQSPRWWCFTPGQPRSQQTLQRVSVHGNRPRADPPAMAHVLIVDDEPDLAQLIDFNSAARRLLHAAGVVMENSACLPRASTRLSSSS